MAMRVHTFLVGVLAAGALVACGDDTTATGSGGGGTGGDSSADTTAVTTTAGNGGGDATTTTTTSGTAGGSGDCEAITLEAFEEIVSYAHGAAFEYGAADPDTVQVAVYVNAPGEHDLGSGANATAVACEQCVFAFVDDDGEAYGGVFFATEGTLSLPDGPGEASLADVVLREIDQESEDAALLDGGRCLTFAAAAYDYDNPVPGDWTCDPTYYADEFFCDCACGGVDPDCDVGINPTFGCEESADGAYCTADGVCGDLPTWWECDPSELDDGTTCDCECGGPDGDCFAEDPLPIVNCTAGDNCGFEGVCLPPESECEDLGDSDEDNSIDCADATACSGTTECDPGATAQNGACDVHSDCASANDAPLCITPAFGVFQNMCSQWCDIDADDCGGTELCFDLGTNEGICLTDCTDDECPDGFVCNPLDEEGTINACLPDVPEEWTCDPAFYFGGIFDGCDCGCGIIDPDCGDDTSPEACIYCGEGSCAAVGDEGECDLDALADDDNSVCE